MLETARGRWFLSEYSKRNRSAETIMLLEAIRKLGAAAVKPKLQNDTSAIGRALIEMAEAISQTRKEIAAIRTAEMQDCQVASATQQLDGSVEAQGKAALDVLRAVEDIQALAGQLRDKGVEEDAYNRLHAHASKIHDACSRQNAIVRGMSEIVGNLRFLERRLQSMIDICGLEDQAVEQRPSSTDRQRSARPLNGPALGSPMAPEPVRIADDPVADVGNQPPPAALAASHQVGKAVENVLAGGSCARVFAGPEEPDVKSLEDARQTAVFT